MERLALGSLLVGPGHALICIILRLLGKAVDAIKPDTEAGLEKWLGINAEYARVWPNITVKREPPPDAKEWEDKPDKANLLSPNPGTGD